MNFSNILFDDIEPITFEHGTKVLESMQMELDKEYRSIMYYTESAIYQEGVGRVLHNLVNKIITFLKKWYRILKSWLGHIKDVLKGMLVKVRKNGQLKSASAIARDHAKERLDPDKQLKESKIRVRVPYLGGVPEAQIEVINSNLVIDKFISDTEFEIGIIDMVNYMKDERNGKRIAMRPTDSDVTPIESVMPYDIRAIYLMKHPDVLQDLNAIVKDAAKIAAGDTTIDQAAFVKRSRDCRHKFKNPAKILKCFVSGKTILSMPELVEFQKKVAEALVDLDEIHNIENDLNTVKDDTLKELKKLVHDVHWIQYDMNTFTNMIQKVNLIDLKYMNSIKDRDVLSKFVTDLITNGIPSKYVAYNTWLIAHEDLRGSDQEYKINAGQSRFCFFPNDDKKEVLKIAMNGFGITSNRNEIRFAKAVSKDPELRKMTAMVTHTYSGDGIIAAERIVDTSGVKHPTVNDCKAMTKAYDDFTKKHPELKLKIKDFNDGNIRWSTDRNRWVSIDYGFSVRTS